LAESRVRNHERHGGSRRHHRPLSPSGGRRGGAVAAKFNGDIDIARNQESGSVSLSLLLPDAQNWLPASTSGGDGQHRPRESLADVWIDTFANIVS
jgi:hypothetical protein